jgi:hypothetical protein
MVPFTIAMDVMQQCAFLAGHRFDLPARTTETTPRSDMSGGVLLGAEGGAVLGLEVVGEQQMGDHGR